ncbi:MAG: HlyU family transcriptional regulator [Pseudomonadota bacterium]
MSLFSRLFGGGSQEPDPPESYEGFTITPEPIKDGNHFRIAARIEKEVAGQLKSHHLIRADTLESHEAAKAASLGKARQVIDEQGERLFD